MKAWQAFIIFLAGGLLTAALMHVVVDRAQAQESTVKIPKPTPEQKACNQKVFVVAIDQLEEKAKEVAKEGFCVTGGNVTCLGEKCEKVLLTVGDDDLYDSGDADEP